MKLSKYIFLFFISFLSLSNQANALVSSFESQEQEYLVFSINAPTQSDVKFASSLTGWDSEDHIKMNEVGYGFYTLAIPIPWYYGITYKFIINNKWQEDPENPNKMSDGHGGWNSVVEINFTDTELISEPSGMKWVQQDFSIQEQAKSKRKITVLAPPFKKSKNLRTIYFLDGGDYLNKALIANVLSNYYQLTQTALIAVLIPPVDRMNEYGSVKVNSHDLFITNKVIPFIESKFGVSRDRNDRMIIGPSLGGLAAFRLGFLTQAFGNVVSQSGSFWFVEKELDEMLNNKAFEPNFYMIDGFFETGIVKSNILLAEKLQSRNIKYTKKQTPSAHNWLAWRNQLPDILDWFVSTH